jgi:hypothetical protein
MRGIEIGGILHLEGGQMAHIGDYVVPFQSDDGFSCNLFHAQSKREPNKGPVLLIHGIGVRINIFRTSVEITFVDCLVDHEHDVCLKIWHVTTIAPPPDEWTLDQALLYDHSTAVRPVLKQTGGISLKVAINCQGSTSFMISAVVGLVPQVTIIVSNTITLNPVASWPAKQKLHYAGPTVGLLTPYIIPQWGEHPEGWVQHFLKCVAELIHHECRNAVHDTFPVFLKLDHFL